ncbi:hypothetical protein ACWEO2_31865 [Nocardia sp. NPDC004278]
MKQLGSISALIGTALALTIWAPATANAATGTFEYTAQSSNAPEVLNNPKYRNCYNISGRNPKNGVDIYAVLYADANCSGDAMKILDPAEGYATIDFRSVLFSD